MTFSIYSKEVFESRATDPIYGGLWIFTEYSRASYTLNMWDWVGGTGAAEINFGFSNNMPPGQEKLSEHDKAALRNQSILSYLTSPEKGGMTTIHELMHAALKGRVFIGKTSESAGSDIDYAYAAADLAGDKRPVFIWEKYVLYPEFKSVSSALPPHIIVTCNTSESASAYWGQRLNYACKYPSYLTGKPTFFKLYKEDK